VACLNATESSYIVLSILDLLSKLDSTNHHPRIIERLDGYETNA